MEHVKLMSGTMAFSFQPPPSHSFAVVLRAPAFRPLCLSSSAASHSNNSEVKMNEETKLFVFGSGFVGRYVSTKLLQEHNPCWEISGTCTSTLKKSKLEALGVKADVYEATKHRLDQLSSLQDATHLLVSIPPLPTLGDPLLFMLEDLRNKLSNRNLRWICYLSSTSVYGDCQGALVDEDFPTNPESESAKARLAAENGWLDLGSDLHVPTYIFRLGGIYGPGRSALDTIKKGKPLTPYQRTRETKCFVARVHVADVYQAIKASFSTSASGVINVVDDDPAPRSEVFKFARNLLEEKFPSRIEVDLLRKSHIDGQGVSMKGEKRVSNARLKKELGVNLIYPSYREGLRSILDSLKVTHV